MGKLIQLVLLCALALLVACNAPTATVTPVPQPTAVPPTETPIPPTATATDIPATATPSPTATPDFSQVSPLYDVAWDDRSLFADGLISADKPILDALPGAPVYHLDVALSSDNLSLTGTQAVRFTNTEEIDLNEAVFRLFPNILDGGITVSNIKIDGKRVVPTYELQQSVMRLGFGRTLAPNEAATITMDIAVTIPTEGGGNYGTFVFDEDILALSHFFPILAVYDDEGWNLEIPPESGDVTYTESSFFIVRVSADEKLTLIASGNALNESFGDGIQTVTYAAGPVRDFYIAASTRFTTLTAQFGETTINAYAPTEFQAANQFLLDKTVASLESFTANFGAYPFTEFDVVSTPTLALGVEYPGIVVMALRMYDSEEGYPLSLLDSVMAHETAHQWFYSTVGNDQLDEPWLDEAMAQYATWLYFEDAYGTTGERGFFESVDSRWERLGRADVPIGQPVAAYNPSEYGAIVYGRGPILIKEWEKAVGKETFAAFLKEYYKQNKWGIATTNGYKTLLEQFCSCDLGEQFQSNVYGE